MKRGPRHALPLRALAVTLLALAPASGSAVAQGPQGADPAAVARAIQLEEQYPTSLGPSSPLTPSSTSRGESWDVDVSAVEPVVQVLVWGAFALLIAALVWSLVSARRLGAGRAAVRRRAEAATPRRQRAAMATAATFPSHLSDGDPDALAAEGRFSEAMAALLARALKGVGWGKRAADRALTAREVVLGLPPADARRPVLARATLDTELVRYGGRPATEGAYQALRERLRPVLPPDAIAGDTRRLP